MGEFVRIDIEGGVATIRIDRPPANALARAVSLELSEAAETVTGDDAVRAVVVWGGERIFAAGADIKAMVDYGPERGRGGRRRVSSRPAATSRRSRRSRSPRSTGSRSAAASRWRSRAIFRFAAQDARLGLPEIKLGIIPGSGGTQRLPRLVGLAQCAQMIYIGRQVSADRGAGIGSRRRGSPCGRGVPGAREPWAETFATGPSLAFAAAKRALAAADRPLEEGLRVEREAFVALFATRDQEEGMRAFLDKREPRFEGR